MKKAPEKFRFAAVAVDAVVLGLLDGELQALVATVNRPPHYINLPGFLGGVVTVDETTEQACDRVLQEKGGLKKIYTEQLYTFSAVNRDKRNRVVSVAYLGLVRPEVLAAYQHETAQFRPLKKIRFLAYDHNEMLQVALQRLAGKVSYSTIAQYLLPRQFTLSQLQTVYEVVTGRVLDKRNFRKKILAFDIIRDTGKVESGVQHRPAALYEFVSQKLEELPLLT